MCSTSNTNSHSSLHSRNLRESYSSTDSQQELEAFLRANVPFYDHVVHHSTLFESCKELLAKVFVDWNIEQDVVLSQCKDGLTNKLIQCSNQKIGQTVLVRAYGRKSEIIIDRKAELNNFITLSKAGLSPALYARFTNGFLYGYIEGKALGMRQIADPAMMALIARKTAIWHKLHIPGKPKARLFTTLWKWYNGVPSQYEDASKQQLFQSGLNMGHLATELARLEAILTRLDSPIVFCHNDLLAANIIYEPEKNDVSFIDFEYGCMNYRGFDIGNHFNEYAGFECDYSKYPKRNEQLQWLRHYLREVHQGGEGGPSAMPSEEEVEKLYLEVNLFSLASHLYWGLWGLVQASFSDIAFDYLSYALMRFRQFEATKEDWIGRFLKCHPELDGKLEHNVD